MSTSINTRTRTRTARMSFALGVAAVAFGAVACGTDTGPSTAPDDLQPAVSAELPPRSFDEYLYPRPYRSADHPSARAMGGDTSRPGLP
jgi:hypothetical protein